MLKTAMKKKKDSGATIDLSRQFVDAIIDTATYERFVETRAAKKLSCSSRTSRLPPWRITLLRMWQ
jgi:hypothetical protein